MTIELYDTDLVPAKEPAPHHAPRMMPASWRLVEPMLARIRHGSLRVFFPNGGSRQYGNGTPAVTLHIHSANVIGTILKAGDIGLAQAYIDGAWSTEDLPGLLTLLARNRAALESLVYGSRWASILYRIRHLLHRNSKAGSRRNIHAHYDIGNAFYRLWLDASMTYSSAIFSAGREETLFEAQRSKYRRILQELELYAMPYGAKVLEIGCGWGGFAEIAAREAGARVTGLTLSTEQLAYADQRMVSAGLEQRVDLRLQDYRDIEGKYDAIASIEMFEAVGEAYWDDYFSCIARCLKAHGRACIQTITIDDELFERYRSGTDFIQQYIFPGGMLPSIEKFREAAGRQGLQVINEFAFGHDYARTLRTWRDTFHHALPEVRELGFDERFIRTWDFYLAYCEAGFEAGNISVVQFTLQKS